jgi:hypothetical protein
MDAVHAAVGQKRIERYSSDQTSQASVTGVVGRQAEGPQATPTSNGNATSSKPLRQSGTLLTGGRWSKPAPPQDKMVRCKCTVCEKSYVVDNDSVIKRCPYCGASQPAEKKRSLFRG